MILKVSLAEKVKNKKQNKNNILMKGLKMKRFYGFTLAEVLITLAIIGVAAQRAMYQAQAKK